MVQPPAQSWVTSLLRSSLLLENLQEWRLLRETCSDCPYSEEVFSISGQNKPRSSSPHRAGAPTPSSLGGFLLNLLQFINIFIVFEDPKLDALFCVVLKLSGLLTVFLLLEWPSLPPACRVEEEALWHFCWGCFVGFFFF